MKTIALKAALACLICVSLSACGTGKDNSDTSQLISNIESESSSFSSASENESSVSLPAQTSSEPTSGSSSQQTQPLPEASGQSSGEDSHAQKNEDGVEFYLEADSFDVDKETFTATIVNNSSLEILYDSSYRIEHLKDEKWQLVPLQISLDIEGKTLPVGESVDIYISLWHEIQQYEPGIYRVCKEYFSGYKPVEITAEFELILISN